MRHSISYLNSWKRLRGLLRNKPALCLSAGAIILFQVYSFFPKSGYVYTYENKLPAAGLDLYLIHYREYRFKLGMEKLSGECVLLHHTKTNKNGHYSVGWIPFLKRDPVSLRKKLTFSVDAYIPFAFDGESGHVKNMYELRLPEADGYPYGYTPPDLYVRRAEFSVLRRISFISRFLNRLEPLCGLSKADHKVEYERLIAKMKPEIEFMYPLWLKYLRDHPYDITTGPYSHVKFRGDALFLEILGEKVRAELASASYPKATVSCKELYTFKNRPNNMELSWEACFAKPDNLDVQNDAGILNQGSATINP